MMAKPDYANMPQSEPHWNRAGKVVKHVKGEDKYSDIEILPILGFSDDGQPEFAKARKIRVFAPLAELVKGSIICGCATFQQNGKYSNVTMGGVFRRDGADWVRIPSATGNVHKAKEPDRPEPWPEDEAATIQDAPASTSTPPPASSVPWDIRRRAVEEMLDVTHAVTAAFLERKGMTCGDDAWMALFKYVGMCLKIDADGMDAALEMVSPQESTESSGDVELPPDSDIPF